MNLSYRDEMPPVPKKTKKTLFSFTPRTLMFIGIGVGLAVLALFLLIWSNSGSISSELQRLSARLDTMQIIVDESHDSIQDRELRKLNSDLRILTTGSVAKLKAPMATAGMGTVSGDIRTAEADTATIQELEKAKTGGFFDRTYARIIRYKIDTITILMQEIYDKTRNQELRGVLSETYNDFTSIHKQLEEDIDV